METIDYSDFEKVALRVGRVQQVEAFPEARKPAYKLTIDFGPEIGVKKSSAQVTDLYQPADLEGRLVVAVVNFAPKQIGPLMSECLVVGTATEAGHIALLGFEQDVPLGSPIF